MHDSLGQETGARDSEAQIHLGEVYRDLLSWGVTLPIWQQELLRRLIATRTLSQADIDELAAEAVHESEQQSPRFVSLSHADMPAIAGPEGDGILVAMKHLHGVNVLRSDQTLTFGTQLTVIYGANASGKSGYGRVLKKVHRARVVDEILGDVHAEKVWADGPCATFIVRTADDVEATVEWKDGRLIDGVGRFAVLDGACSATYIRGGTLAVGPAGIDVPGRFADELDRIKRALAAKAARAQPEKQTIQRLEGVAATGG